MVVEYAVGPHSLPRVLDLKVDVRHDLQARCSEVVEGGRWRSKKERASQEAREALLDRQVLIHTQLSHDTRPARTRTRRMSRID